MDTSFILSCESTIDLPYSYCEARGIPVLFYSYQVDGVSYEDDMGRDPAALPRFYGFLDEGKLPTTAQLNEFQYESFFDALLQQGDVLQISGFGSFEVKEREARVGRNPQTGEAMEIAASRIPAFKAGKALKDRVAK